MKAIRKPGKQERRKEVGQLATHVLHGGATTSVGAAPSACRGCPRYLFVRDGSTRRAGKMDDFKALEPTSRHHFSKSAAE